MRTKSFARLDREIAEALTRSPRHHATVATAAPHVTAIYDAIHRTKDPDALIAAVAAAQKHVAAMKRIARKPPKHPGSSAQVDMRGEYDPAMYELVNLLVKAKEMVRRIKIERKTGRFPKPSRRTAWKLKP